MMIRNMFALASLAFVSGEAIGQDQAPAGEAPAEASSDAELAKKLANPVAHLISVPFQLNYDCCAGVSPDNDGRYTLNVQPVVPITLNDNLNLIIRTILPINYREGRSSIDGEGFGLGDTTQSFFFSPPSKDGFTWAAGPAFLWPTGAEGFESGKWGAGPTVLLLKQQGPLTYGILANHIWSYAGSRDRPDVSSTFLQPFVNYTFPDTFGITLNTESTYDWITHQWTVPVNLLFSRIIRIGHQPQLQTAE
jgi:hypothetical protein